MKNVNLMQNKLMSKTQLKNTTLNVHEKHEINVKVR